MLVDKEKLFSDHRSLAVDIAYTFDWYGTGPVEDRESFSDALLALWCSVRRYDPSRGVQFTTFAYKRIAKAVADGVQYRRGIKRSGRRVLFCSCVPDRITDDTTAEDRDEFATWRSKYDRLLERLPPSYKKVMRLKIQGKTNQEISKCLGMTEKHVHQAYKCGVNTMKRLAVTA